MRLWTFHPAYLDVNGLTGLWREALLAQKVLQGQTRGYKNHPQLMRFKSAPDPLVAISVYLQVVAGEGRNRGYHFDESKILPGGPCPQIPTTLGQLLYEWNRLNVKLMERDPARREANLRVSQPLPHPLFHIVPGDIEPWERSIAS
jgi:hypothetical protein